jgi:sensor histidine kinase regulating citrate/malate metabolism
MSSPSVAFPPPSVAEGIQQSRLSPKYLESNSTSHNWPFSAVAELIDNAYDPDVNARELRIELKPFTVAGMYCFTFTDDGNGMNADSLHKMLRSPTQQK